MNAQSRVLSAVLLMFVSGTCFTAMGAIIKHLSAQGLPVAVIGFARISLGLLFIAPWVLRTGVDGVRTQRLREHVVRSTFGACSLVCYVIALATLDLADAVALSYTSPLWAIPVAMLVLGEPPQRHRIAAAAVGFVGVLVLVRPGFAFDPFMLVALASALFTSLAQSTMRRLTSTEPGERIVLYFGLVGTVLTAGPAWFAWQSPTAAQWAWLLAAAAFAHGGLICATRAFERAEVTLLAPIDYLRLPVAAVIGLLVFGEVPVVWTFVGTAIIAASTLAVVRADRQRAS